MKKGITLFILFFSTCMYYSLAFSANVSVEKALTVAVNFAKQQIDAKSTEMSLVYTRDNTAYVFSNGNMWVMIAADDRAKPVLAYSTEGSFRVPSSDSDTIIGDNFWGWIKSYQEQIQYAIANDIPASQEISDQWQTLSSDNIDSQAGNDRGTTTVVNPLLSTTWGQGWPYNSMCPVDPAGPGGHVWAGCVATAMAQIMKYHNYPAQGLGSYGYQYGNYPYTGANFGATTYNWSNMPNSISTVNNDISTITYHAAVSTLSMWGSASTGVGWYNDQEPMTRAFVNYFRMAYSSLEYVKKVNYTTTDWYNLLDTELLANRPVYYRGNGTGGHAWVCDGVDANTMYHFNWGWDGDYNGYYSLNAINPGSQNFNDNQTAIIGIQANDGSTLVSNTTWSGNINHSNKIAVPDAITLTVQPGSNILFGGGAKLQVYGRLLSIGTANNYVRFSSIDTNNRWHGIKWDNEYNWYDVMADNDSSKLIYTQVEYSGNSGLYASAFGKILVKNSKINNNSGGHGAGIFINWYSIDIWDSEIYKNHATFSGGGIYIQSTQNGISNICQNDIYDNMALGGGALTMSYGNANIISNTVRLNQAIQGSGISILNSSPLIENNRFVNNLTVALPENKGTLYLSYSNPDIVGNLFANNDGSAIYMKASSPTLVNSTMVNNYNYYTAGMVFEQGSDPIIKNCIVYGNIAELPLQSGQIRIIDADSDPIFDHCDIQGGLAGFGGAGAGSNYNPANYTNNINADPIFVDPTTGAGAGYDGLLADYSVQGNSPCIDAGTTSGIINILPALDLAGNPRINGIIDMGSYEYCSPAQPSTIAGNATPCQGSSQVYSVTNVTGISYTWTVPTGSTITAGQGTNSITVTVGSSSGNISVTPSNSCGNGTAQSLAVTVNALPAQPSTIAGNATPCQGSSQVYSVTNVTGISYTWTVPNTWTITAGQGSNSITVTVGTNAGNISVTPSNSCGNGTAQSLAVTVTILPANAGTITGLNQVCKGSNGVVYTVPVIANASNYNWSVPSGVTIVSGGNTNSITVNFTSNAVSGNISVYGSNSCGDGQSSNLFVTVNYVTADAGVDQTIPYGTATTLSGNASNGSGDYSWSWQPVNLLVNANVQNPTTTNLTVTSVFTLTVTDISTGCISSDNMTVLISGGPLGVITTASPSTICDGQSSQLLAIASGGSGNYTYSWTSNPSGFTSTIANPIVSPSVSTTYTVTVNDGNNTAQSSVNVTVNYVPGQANQPDGPDSVDLHYTSVSQYTTIPVANTDYYNWILEPANMGTINSSGNSAVISWSGQLGAATLKVRGWNSNCEFGPWSEEKNIWVDNTSGIEQTKEEEIKIFPNPAKSQVTVEWNQVPVSVELLNSEGQCVMSTFLNGDKTVVIDVSHIRRGLYVLVIKNKTQIGRKKLIIH